MRPCLYRVGENAKDANDEALKNQMSLLKKGRAVLKSFERQDANSAPLANGNRNRRNPDFESRPRRSESSSTKEFIYFVLTKDKETPHSWFEALRHKVSSDSATTQVLLPRDPKSSSSRSFSSRFCRFFLEERGPIEELSQMNTQWLTARTGR